MERLTNKREADAQRKAYETRMKQGYPRNIPEERFTPRRLRGHGTRAGGNRTTQG